MRAGRDYYLERAVTNKFCSHFARNPAFSSLHSNITSGGFPPILQHNPAMRWIARKAAENHTEIRINRRRWRDTGEFFCLEMWARELSRYSRSMLVL
jgi:hypothetical protein